MKTNLISALLILAIPAIVRAGETSSLQVWPDDWMGDTALFIFEPETDQLRLDAPREADDSYIFKSSDAIEDARWETSFHFDFNPSSANFLKIYLATDGGENFENGFYLVAGTTSDNICLWERRGGEDRLLIEGVEDRLDHSPVNARVRVMRERGGSWLLETDAGDGWQTEGEAQSDFGFPGSQFGFSCHYTKTRCDKFRLGPLSISGEAYRDTVPPEMKSVEVLNGYTLEIDFSETIDPSLSDAMVETSSGAMGVHEMEYNETGTQAVVRLDQQLSDAEEKEMSLSGWCDEAGNAMNDTTFVYSYQAPRVTSLDATDYRHLKVCFNRSFPSGFMEPRFFCFEDTSYNVAETERAGSNCYLLRLKSALPDAQEMNVHIGDLVLPGGDTIPEGPYPVYYHEASPFDLAITEIMHDPSPPALLPESEYIELLNRSELPVNLKNMNLQINGRDNILPSQWLFPNEYVVLFRKNDDGWDFPNSLPLEKWHALTNGGGEIVLRNPSGQVVTAFRYPGVLETSKEFKQKGGWSFEVIDPDNLSGSLRNWAYCRNDTGGSPGKKNSVDGPHPDGVPPSLKDAWLESDSVLVLDFGEPVKVPRRPGSAIKEISDGVVCDSLFLDSVFRDRLTVAFHQPLPVHQVQSLEITDALVDQAGNVFPGPDTLRFGRPGPVDSLDIVINELMYDPPPEGGDYVELYNCSGRIAALDSICLARAGEGNDPEELVPLSDRTRWFLPGQHLCFTPEPAWVEENYPGAEVASLRSLPNLPNYVNDGGKVFLTRKNGRIIDLFPYLPGLHFPLLSDTKAVALERTRPDAPSGSPSTWHSASSVTGYGTPGAPNSQKSQPTRPDPDPFFELSPEVFTPDLDGFNDRLIISYSFNREGYKGTIKIFDSDGRPVKTLLNNKLLGASGHVEWDGTRDDQTLCPPGIYVVWGEVFNTEGNVKRHKATCVLGVRGE
ncbi:MAG: lamin tail domain-containing protein [Marinilabiliaceae bacterium]